MISTFLSLYSQCTFTKQYLKWQHKLWIVVQSFLMPCLAFVRLTLVLDCFRMSSVNWIVAGMRIIFLGGFRRFILLFSVQRLQIEDVDRDVNRTKDYKILAVHHSIVFPKHYLLDWLSFQLFVRLDVFL